MRQGTQGWCTGMTQRDGMGREVGRGFTMGNTCKPMANSCECMAKPTTILWEKNVNTHQFSSVQSLSRVWLFVIPWIAVRQASLSITNSQSSPKLMCIESVMPSSHPIFCCPLLLLPPIPSSIRVFSNESTLHMRWPKYGSFSLSISPSNESTLKTDLF